MDEELLNSNNWFNYADFYSWVAEKKHFEIFVEVGVWKGHSISFLANLLRDRKAQIWAVDSFSKNMPYPETEIIYQIYNENLRRSNTRHLIMDLIEKSEEAAKTFFDESIDFCFIDADHSYEQVKLDILSWIKKIKIGGILAGHDYHERFPGVIKAVDEIFGHNKKLIANTVWYVEKTGETKNAA